MNPLTPEQVADGWIMLFDAVSTFGWHHDGQINWSVEDQSLTADSGPIGLLLTDVPFADFELELEFSLSEHGNSGVFIRCVEQPTKPGGDCYEINIADVHPEGFTSGSLVGLQTASQALPTADGKWHAMAIRAEGKKIEVTVDGQVLCQFEDDRPEALTSGLIGLQKNAGKAAYRNIRLKPLGTRPLFNGTDLAGWHEVPGSQSVIDVVEGSIHVVNGPGFLETDETFQNFVLQFEAKTSAVELNSGLFFRAMPGTEENPSNGYEVQIHNGFHEGDRNRPNNAGTGAIFRRIEARRVVSSDQQWCTLTLITSGNQISTWVDGYPVVSWKDDRKPDENPRKGQRLEAGHLSLQGHDPTTDLFFRNIRIEPLP
ncbi:MAG: DUF1080 domain-containing protein [Planctomycetaceae bacterium]|nr:DUF1080 domain-containing protein [Planctomycetaceae bacterium]